MRFSATRALAPHRAQVPVSVAEGVVEELAAPESAVVVEETVATIVISISRTSCSNSST